MSATTNSPDSETQTTDAQGVDLSPLLEATSDSLDELFNRNPEDLSRGDIVTIVEAFRRMRSKWKEDEAQGKTRSSAAKAPKAAPVAKKSLKDILSEEIEF